MQEEKRYSDGEEIANTATHGAGVLLAAAGMLELVRISSCPRALISSIVYTLSAILMFTMSSLYHGIRKHDVKQFCRKLDHSMIYILIAGTYTPILLMTFSSGWEFVFLIFAWCLAAAGVIASFISLKNRLLGTVIYLIGGWLGLCMMYYLWTRFPHAVLFWLVGGGLVYSLGCIFYMRRRAYSHAVWHLFVLAGCFMHFMSIRLILLSH